MNDLTFLDEELANGYGAGDATLKAVLPGGKVVHISDNISPFKFLDTCPLMYHAFEYNSQSRLQASIEASSETAVISLARYCYTGSYLAGEPDGESILLLQHAETYKIAEDFDVPELQIMAHGNFSCQIEYACCLPKPPKDLLDTVRFIYRHFASDEARRDHNLVDTLLNYCVAVYLYHKLGESLDFLTAVHEIPSFRQDLCRTNIARNFEDDCAAEIIRLPSGPMIESSNAPTTLASRELPSEMLYDMPCDSAALDLSSADPASTESAPAGESKNSVTLSVRRKAFGAQTLDQSNHGVSPYVLTTALEKYIGIMSSDAQSDTELDTVVEETLRKYKRAKTGELTARRYGRRNVRPVQKATLSTPTVETNVSTTLPHRPRDSETIPDSSIATDTASEDEGFAMVHLSQAAAGATPHSPMSSPELVPMASIAQTMVDEKAASDDDWDML